MVSQASFKVALGEEEVDSKIYKCKWETHLYNKQAFSALWMPAVG